MMLDSSGRAAATIE